jgi:hypothetical protein
MKILSKKAGFGAKSSQIWHSKTVQAAKVAKLFLIDFFVLYYKGIN